MTTQEATAEVKGVSAARNKVIMDQVVSAHAEATDEDRALVKSLVDQAKSGKRASIVVTLTPGAAASLFFDHNKQNRAWRAAVSEEYAIEINRGEWAFTNQGIGFLISGNVGDGQHRLGGIALSGKSVETPVTFGMVEDSIIAIDIGHRRQAYDFLGIGDKVLDAKRKQAMVKQAFAALKRLAADEEEARPYMLRPGNRDTVAAITANNKLLDDSIQIGDDSVQGRSKPTFKAAEAASLTFLLLLKGWPKAKVIADLDVFQSGEDREGGNSPLFVAADQLQKDAQKREGATVSARFAAAIKAFVLHEQGIKAVRVSEIRNAMKANAGVDASFPGTRAA